MSEEVQETTEQTDEEKNFAALREKVETYEARIAELSPLAKEKAVREAGFNPDTPEGKALSRLAGDEADADAVKNLAVELGFEATTQDSPKHEPTKEERAAQEFADRQSHLSQTTVSDEPPTDLEKIAEAEAKANETGDWSEVMRLKIQGMTVGG